MDWLKHPTRRPPSVLLVATFFLAFSESALISRPEQGPLPVLADKLETDASNSYAFDYSVSDARTGDAKSQWETQLGGVVRGQYALLGPDGNLRSVSYTADDANGFQAVVRYTDPHQILSEEGLDVGPGPATHSSERENQSLEQPLPSGLGVLRPGHDQYIALEHDGVTSMYRYQPPLYDSGYRLQPTFPLPNQSSYGYQEQLQNQLVSHIQPPPWTAATGGVPGQSPWRTWTWSNQPQRLPEANQPISPKPPAYVNTGTSYVHYGKPHIKATTIGPTPRPETQCQKEWRPVTAQYTAPNIKYHTKGDKIYWKGGGGDRTSPGGGTREIRPSTDPTAPGSGSILRVPGNLLYSEAPAALYIPFPGGPRGNGGTTTTAAPTGTKTPTIFADPARDPAGFISPLQFIPTDPTVVRGSSTTPSYYEPPSFNHPDAPNYADALLTAISELARAPTRESIRAEPENPPLTISDIELERVPIELIRVPTEEPLKELGKVESTLYRPPKNVPQSKLELERVPIEIARIPTLQPQIVPTREPERSTTPPQKSQTRKRKTTLKNSNVNSKEVDNSISPSNTTEKPPRKTNSKKRASVSTKRGKPITTAAPSTKKHSPINKLSTPGETSSQKPKVASNRNRGQSIKSTTKKNSANHTVTTPKPEAPNVQINAETSNSVVHTNRPEPVDFVSIPTSTEPSIQAPNTSEPSIQAPNTSVPTTLVETTTNQFVNTTDSKESSQETQGTFQNEYIDKAIFDSPRFQIKGLKTAQIDVTTPNPSTTSPQNTETHHNTIPYIVTTQSPNGLIETTSPLYENITESLVKDEWSTTTETTPVTTPFLKNHVDSYKLEPDTSGTTQQYTVQKHRPFFPTVFVNSDVPEAVTDPPQSFSTTEKDFEFFNLTENSFDTATSTERVPTTTGTPFPSRIYPLKMLSSPTERSMDFSSFNDDGIFEQDVLDPAVALSERVSVSLETTTSESVLQPNEDNRVKDVPPPPINGACHYSRLISFVSCFAMFLPIITT